MAIPTEEAREEIPNIDSFCKHACINCSNDWFCPSFCDMLEKAIKMDYELLVKCYARNDGDWSKVYRYIKVIKNYKKLLTSKQGCGNIYSWMGHT